MNRLGKEKSPYLLQHADNPIDWFPWGQEALMKAKKEHKPVFLSIGYSSCHWCHVMEKESFTRDDIAKILNEDFVAIKVDREERPDIDNYFMKAIVGLTGSGGWPINIFLTPEGRPFYGGTYFPPEDSWGKRGLKKTLLSVANVWKEMSSEIETTADLMIDDLNRRIHRNTSKDYSLDEKTLARVYNALEAGFDRQYGGFGSAPKFPNPSLLLFLNRFWHRSHNKFALGMTEKTLREMAQGGIFDHLGGGFHRYSTDRQWQVPHFEKMLYDQALLSRVYLEAYQATGRNDYAWITKEIFDYVLREMTSGKGGFYSAADADSQVSPNDKEREEGAFYLWTKEEILEVLGKEKGEMLSYYFGVTEKGNISENPLGESRGKNVLSISHPPLEVAQQFHKNPIEVLDILADGKERLLNVRSLRPKPEMDDKILTDWNGLMIASLAFGGRVLAEEEYIDAAMRATEFVLTYLTDERKVY